MNVNESKLRQLIRKEIREAMKSREDELDEKKKYSFPKTQRILKDLLRRKKK